MRSQGLGRTKQQQLEGARAGRYAKGGVSRADGVIGGTRPYDALNPRVKPASASMGSSSRITKGATGQGPGYVSVEPTRRRPVPSMNPSTAGRWPTRS